MQINTLPSISGKAGLTIVLIGLIGVLAQVFTTDWSAEILPDSTKASSMSLILETCCILQGFSLWLWNYLHQQFPDRAQFDLRQTAQSTQATLQQREAELGALFDAMSDLVIVFDDQGQYLKIPPANPHLLYRPIAEVLGKKLHDVLPSALADRFFRGIQQSLSARQTINLEYSLDIHGQVMWFSANISPLTESSVVWVIRDISERKRHEADRKQAEIALRESEKQLKATLQEKEALLQEKEALLREIHHRVKNNLYVISNLLDLQSETIVDQQLLTLFADCQSRIQAMALIHEQLYQSQDLGQVDISEYLHRLVNNLCFCYGESIGRIQPIVAVEPIRLNLETVIPCGLIINELITNSFKHAFPDDRSGEVHVQLHAEANQQLHLIVRDTGIGISPEFDWHSAPSLGLKLVRILAQQLKATLSFDRSNGTAAHLSFTELKYKSRF